MTGTATRTGAAVVRIRRSLDELSAPPPPSPRPYDPPTPRAWSYRAPRTPMRHLAGRFFVSLRPGGPSPASTAWAAQMLTDAEFVVFSELPGFDRRHAIGVAKAAHAVTEDALVARAALLHDVGKVDCGLGPVGRAVATLYARAASTAADLAVRDWIGRAHAAAGHRLRPRTWRERFASYLAHPWVGRALLEDLGSDPAVSAWAEQHHHMFVPDDLCFGWHDACVLWLADND